MTDDLTDDLRTRITALIAAHEPVTDYEGADGECIECDLNPRWPDAPILPPSDGWKEHAEHLADALTGALEADYVLVPKSHTLVQIARYATGEVPCETRYATEWERFDG